MISCGASVPPARSPAARQAHLLPWLRPTQLGHGLHPLPGMRVVRPDGPGIAQSESCGQEVLSGQTVPAAGPPELAGPGLQRNCRGGPGQLS